MLKRIALYAAPVLAAIALSGCASTSQLMEPAKTDYGLNTYSSFNGEPLTITADTPTLKYGGRMFYFQDKTALNSFQQEPARYILKYQFNETPVIISPLTADYGLKTNCSYDGLPIVVTKFTPTLKYLGRIYYFAHNETQMFFMQNPQIYVAKFPANKPPKIISPLKSDYGTKANGSATGTPLLIGPHTPTLEYLGRIFYFSNLAGMQQFKADPQAYIARKYNTE